MASTEQRALHRGRSLRATVHRRFLCSVWVILAGFLLVLLASLYGILTLNDRSNGAAQAQLLLAQVDGAVHREHYLETDALARQGALPNSTDSIMRARANLARRLAALRQDQGSSSVAPLADVLDRYEAELDTELTLLASGQDDQARALSLEGTTPAFATVEQLLTARATAAKTRADSDNTLADVGTVVVLFAAALFGSLGFVGFARSRRARDGAVAELAIEKAASALRLRDSLLDQVRSAVVGVDATDSITSWNRYAETMYGWAADEVLGRGIVDVLVLESDVETPAQIWNAMQTVGHWEGDILAKRKDGAPFPSLLSLAAVIDTDGTCTGIAAVAQDLTQQKQAEAALKDSETSFRLLFANNPHCMWVYDDQTLLFLEVNDATVEHYGYSRAEFLAMRITDIRPEADVPALLDHVRGSRTALQDRGHWQHRLKDGRLIDVEVASHRVPFADRHGVLVVAQNVTERLQLAAQLEHQAFTDKLTGLPNRALCLDRLAHAVERLPRQVQPLAVLFLDLDRFKLVNDTLGHDAGDALLVEAAARLLTVVRAGDTVARLGGDEFTVLLEEVSNPADALQVAEAAVLAFQRPFLVAEHELIVTASVGVVCDKEASLTAREFLRRADVALYQAKASGRACAVLYDAAMDTNSEARLGLEADLRGAVARNELVLYYQPDIDLTTGKVTGVEALVRWQHPRLGLVPPADFIPLAEETGLIRPIGRWVLREACRQAAEWRATAPELQALVMSVNLSARELEDPLLLDEVAEVLVETALPPHCLRLELTESTMMRRVEEMIPLLHAVKALGVQLAIDDFGTGYSSLSHLARFPVDTLKVDRSFVQRMGTDTGTSAIVETTIALAHALHMDVTAEGIEGAEQLARLRRLHCDRGQGYYFAHPMPAAEVADLLTRSLPVVATRAA